MNKLKEIIKVATRRNSTVSLLVATAWSFLNAPLALAYRLKFVGVAYVPFSVKLIGIRNIYIGKNSSIGARSWLNVNNRGKKRGISISIGQNCIIGQDNFFSTGASISFGDYCLTTKNCSFIGSTHIYEFPLTPYSCSGTKHSDNIKIGTNCFFGYGSQVIGNVTIGHGCVIGAGAVVKEDIPPFSLVAGNPARIIKRYDFKKNTWTRWSDRDEYHEGPSEEEYVLTLEKAYGFILQPISVSSGFPYDLL